jgi:hypothetical protein
VAKPRIFVSSTYYDLRHIRNSLEAIIDGFGYEGVLFESGDIPFRHDMELDKSCYGEINHCHMLILIIGGRYGSPSSDTGKPSQDDMDKAYVHYNSITKKEYETARTMDIPIFIFVEKGVLAEYQTFKRNRENTSIKYAHVDSINIFRLLDEILLQKRNNFIKEFDKFDDIASWLRDQWAGLFCEFLGRKSTEATLRDLASQVTELGEANKTLKKYFFRGRIR